MASDNYANAERSRHVSEILRARVVWLAVDEGTQEAGLRAETGLFGQSQGVSVLKVAGAFGRRDYGQSVP